MLRSQPGVGGRAARELVRSLSPRLGDDRSLTDDIEAVAAAIRDGSAARRGRGRGGELQMTRKQLPVAEAPLPRQRDLLRRAGGPLRRRRRGRPAARCCRGSGRGQTGSRHPTRRVRRLPIALACFVVATGYSVVELPPADRDEEGQRLVTAIDTLEQIRRGALRRPLVDPRAARDGAECPLLVDRGAAADAAEQPRPGGRRASGRARRLRRLGQGGAEPRRAAGDRPLAAHARRRRDAARPERQAGRRPAHPSRRAARPDRERAARPALGDLGRVPPTRGGGADDVRPDDGRQLDLHRHAGDPPGHLPDVRRRRRAAFRLGRSRRAGRS